MPEASFALLFVSTATRCALRARLQSPQQRTRLLGPSLTATLSRPVALALFSPRLYPTTHSSLGIAPTLPSPVAPSPRSVSTSLGPLRPDVKKATEFLCERLFWYLKRDTGDKKLQKLQSDVDRCQTTLPEFGIASELLKQQKDLADEERAKCCSRLDAADEKLQSAVQQLVGRLHQFKSGDITRSQPDPKPSDGPATGLETRLSAARRSAEASFSKMLALESSRIKESLRTEFDAKTAELQAQTVELKAQLYIEKFEKAELKRSLAALEQRVSNSAKVDPGADSRKPEQGQPGMQNERALRLAAKIKEETKGLVSRDELDEALRTLTLTDKIREETRNLVSRDELDQALRTLALADKIKEGTKSLVSRDELNAVLQGLDETMSLPQQSGEADDRQDQRPALGTNTDLRLRALASKLGRLESSVREHDVGQMAQLIEHLRTEVDGHAEAIKRQADQQLDAKALMQTMESTLAKLSAEGPTQTVEASRIGPSGASAASTSHSHIKQIIDTEVGSAIRNLLPIIRNKVVDWLNEERAERELVAKEADKTADAAMALRTDLDKLEQEFTRSWQELGNQVARTQAGLVTAEGRIESLESTCPAARAETKSETDELAMQVRDLQSWQNNFTTRTLYKDIVDHINATLPNGVLTQLHSLASRVAGIEGHLHAAEGAETKKRKLEAANVRGGG